MPTENQCFARRSVNSIFIVRCGFAQYQLIFAARVLRRVRQSFQVSAPTPCPHIPSHPKSQPFPNGFQTVSAIPEAFQLAPQPFAAHNRRQISIVLDGQMGFAESLTGSRIRLTCAGGRSNIPHCRARRHYRAEPSAVTNCESW